MSCYVYCSPSKFNKFYIKDIFDSRLYPVSEKEFNEIILLYRDILDIEYDGVNAQNFLFQGDLVGRRER